MMPLVKTQDGRMIPFKDWPQEIHPERLWVLQQLPAGGVGYMDTRTVLDLGCGAHKTIPQSIGIDIRPGADRQESIDKLWILGYRADVIISRHSFEHLLDPVAALRDWARILRPGGVIVIVLPDHGAVDTMQPVLSAGCHLHAYTIESFRNLVEAVGLFSIDKLEVVVEDWSFGAVMRKLK